MTIKDMCIEIHNNAVVKGFWETFNMAEKLMLIVSELSEAMEADRKNKRMGNSISGVNGCIKDNDFKKAFLVNVKDTFEDELADVCIRIFDLAQKMDIDLESHIRAKMRYNSTREFKHNKKY